MNLICPNCRTVNPRLYYNFDDGELNVACCGTRKYLVEPIWEDGTPLSEEDADDFFKEKERENRDMDSELRGSMAKAMVKWE